MSIEITEAQVEAAAEALCLGTGLDWDSIPEEVPVGSDLDNKAYFRKWVRPALLAASLARPAEAEPFITGRGWQNLTCDDQFRLATSIASNIGYQLVAEPEHPDSPHNAAHSLEPGALELKPVHLRLLKRGERGGYIGLADDAAIHTGEVVALGELRRAGLVEYAKGPFPPGPPSMTPSVITDAGREALKAAGVTR